MPTIEIIKATKKLPTQDAFLDRKLKVGAYARVSTELEEQEGSYESQIKYYTDLINENPRYEFIGMYSDKGITGTDMSKRPGFLKMIDDGLAGKYDLIYVKSISRFGRNVVDVIGSLRKLKSNGVDMIFEKENANLQNNNGEFLLTLYASLAQEESHSISLNTSMGIRAGYKDENKPIRMPYKNFLGYYKGEDGKPHIDEKQAQVVRTIYKLFIMGETTGSIAKFLTANGIKTPTGKDKWAKSSVKSILSNEKYVGDALLQKGYVPDFLTHRVVKNTGQLDKYYRRDNHPAIVSREVYELAQAKLHQMSELGKKVGDIYANKIYCKECGAAFGKKVHHSNTKYRCEIYRCNDEYNKEHKGKPVRLKKEQIHEYFMQAVMQIADNEGLVVSAKEILEIYRDTDSFEKEISDLQEVLNDISSKIEELIKEQSKKGNINDYIGKYKELAKEYENTEIEIKNKKAYIEDRRIKQLEIMNFIDELERLNADFEFDIKLWQMLLDKALVSTDSIDFVFKDETVIKVKIK